MNMLWKVLIGIAATVVVLLVGLAIAVALIFEPNDYRPLIVETVQQSTGRHLELPGDLDLSLFPCCGVSVGPATLSNPEGFPEEPFATLDGAAVSLKLWPLIVRQEVQIGTITLNGLDLRLVQLADGRNNWTFESDAAAATEPTAAESSFSLDDLTIAGLAVRDGRVSYQDLATEALYRISDLRVQAGAIGAARTFPVEASLRLADGSSDAAVDIELNSAVKVSGEEVEINDARITLAGAGSLAPADLRLRLQGNGKAGPSDVQLSGDFELSRMSPAALLEALNVSYEPTGSKALSALSGTGQWRLDSRSAAATDLQFKLDETRITGAFALDDLASGALRLDVHMDEIHLDDYLSAASGQTIDKPSEPTAVPFEELQNLTLESALRVDRLRLAGAEIEDLAVGLASRDDQVSLKLQARTAGGSISADGTGNLAAAAPVISGSLDLVGLSPRTLLESMGEPPETADPGVLANLSGQAQWRLGQRSLAVPELRLQLDQTKLTGSLRVDDFDRMALHADLSLDTLNLDAYLPPETEEAEPTGTDTEIPVDLIRDLNLAGTLKAGRLTVLNLHLENLRAQIRAAEGVLRLDPLRADLYGGVYSGSLSIDATGPKADLAVNQQISAVQIGQLLQDYLGTSQISGALTMDLAGSGAGNTLTDLLQELDGAFSLQLADGVYHGMDISYALRRARALVKKQPPPSEPAQKDTPIRQLSLSGSLADGVLGSEDLTALLPGLRLSGAGGINLIKRVLDYELTAEVLKAAEAAGSEGMDDLVDLTIPLAIAGPVTAPEISVDLQGLVTRAVRDTAEKRARDLLLKKLGGAGTTQPAGSQSAPAGAGTEAPSAEESDSETDATPPAEDASPRDLLKRGLRDLLRGSQNDDGN